jgi:undecaprenyl-diphosphatase
LNGLEALILGAVEGITEFLPVSSTGHLVLAGNLLGLPKTDFLDAFEIVIQSGAIAAILWLRWDRFMALRPGHGTGPIAGRQGLRNLFLCTLPAIILGGLFASKIKSLLFFPAPVALAMAVGAVAILALDRPGHLGTRKLSDLTPRDALLIGLAQCLAMWPGMSRSACTILGAMALGFDRESATEFSFMAAVPVLLLATAHDLVKEPHAFAGHLGVLILGWLCAFVVACLSVRAFLGLLKGKGLRPFAWYRLAAAPIFYFIFVG